MNSAFHGLLVLDKPGGITSRDAVDRAMSWFPRGTRIGHTGTLDPLATGVLVVCLGLATRLSEYVQRMSKTYQARFRLGARSDSDDADGAITEVSAAQPPELDQVAGQLQSLVGSLDQIPPAYSAAKVTGRRAYALARRGETVTLQPRRIDVYSIALMNYVYPHLDVVVHCSKGTYIRSLARDLGEQLGCGALVEQLRRTRIGPFAESGALPLTCTADEARSRLLPVSAALAELPRVCITEPQIFRLQQGQKIPLAEIAAPSNATEVAVFAESGRLVAVANINREVGELQPAKVFSEIVA